MTLKAGLLTQKAGLLRIVSEMKTDLSRLEKSHADLYASAQKLGKLFNSLQMQEMNKSFNLQYLGLQQKMQSDNRQFTSMSNIMKTKHDTAKAAINNVR